MGKPVYAACALAVFMDLGDVVSRGQGFGDGKSPRSHVVHLEQQVADLQRRLDRLEGGRTPTPSAPESYDDGGGI